MPSDRVRYKIGDFESRFTGTLWHLIELDGQPSPVFFEPQISEGRKKQTPRSRIALENQGHGLEYSPIGDSEDALLETAQHHPCEMLSILNGGQMLYSFCQLASRSSLHPPIRSA